jgi:putative DNA primase/helicase
MANGNNLSIAADMARRVLMCGLDARVERPETREFDRDPLEAVRADRGQYVAAALTILRAYVVAGRPRCPKPVGSYEAWSSLVRGALIWLGCPDPAESMSAVREADPRRLQMLAVMAQWAEVIGDARSTVAEIIAAAVCRPGGEFREALLAVAGERGAIDGRRLGRWLGANKGRIVGARWFEAGPLRHGTGTWVLRGDDVGSVPAPSPDRMSDFP